MGEGGEEKRKERQNCPPGENINSGHVFGCHHCGSPDRQIIALRWEWRAASSEKREKGVGKRDGKQRHNAEGLSVLDFLFLVLDNNLNGRYTKG